VVVIATVRLLLADVLSALKLNSPTDGLLLVLLLLWAAHTAGWHQLLTEYPLEGI
jgi:hypothetical protein